MASIRVEGMGRWDGTYDLGAGDRAFNGREWHWIKQASGYMPATIDEGWVGSDPDLFIVLAVIAMCRSGKVDRERGLQAVELMREEPYTGRSITVIGDQVEEDEVPLDLTSKPDESSQNGLLSSDDTKKPNGNSSGSTSPSDSGTSAETPSPTTA